MVNRTEMLNMEWVTFGLKIKASAHTHARDSLEEVTVVASGKGNGRQEERDGKEI